MSGKNSNYSPAAAAMTASLLMLVIGLAHYALAARLAGSPSSTPIAPDALERFPMQIAGWTGQDVPLDEAIVRKTRSDAHINRRYSRGSAPESISFYVACGVNICGQVSHRPELCYVGAGWVLAGHRSVELLIGDGMTLPCNIREFVRGGLVTERVTVLNYFIADGLYCRNISRLRSRVWRVFTAVDYVAQVQIVASTETLTTDEATRIVSDFAVDSASQIMKLFDHIEKDQSMASSHGLHERKQQR